MAPLCQLMMLINNFVLSLVFSILHVLVFVSVLWCDPVFFLLGIIIIIKIVVANLSQKRHKYDESTQYIIISIEAHLLQ